MALALYTIFLFSLFAFAFASDPSPQQDFCVAVPDSAASVLVNGKICKNPANVVPEDFYFSGLNRAGNTFNRDGSNVTMVNVNQVPGLNTLGVSFARIDFGPNGINSPHIHPRASEVLFVLQGTLYAGFLTSNPSNPNTKNQLYARYLFPGDVFVFPQGLIHFQYNVGNSSAIALTGFGNQNPGVITVANSVFGSSPSINPDVLAKAFQVEKNVVNYLESKF